MANTSSVARTITAFLAFAISGCAIAQGNSGEGATLGAGGEPCGVGLDAMAGALFGALAGALMGDRDAAAKAAAVGAAIGGIRCAMVGVQSNQTKTGAQVDGEQALSTAALPPEPSLVSYTPRLINETVQRGQVARMVSVVELANGSQEIVREVTEEIVVQDPQGQKIRSGSKSFVASSAGRFENTFEVILPRDAPQGLYAFNTNLYVNGRMLASRSARLQVAATVSSGGQ